MEPTVFQQVLGSRYASLPDKLGKLHSLSGRVTYIGRADIQRGSNLLARACAAIAGLPPDMRDALTRVQFTADHKQELWERDFGGKQMSSTLTCRDGLLCEQLGPLQFRFDLQIREGEIWWVVRGVRLLGLLPLPASLFRGVRCREREAQGRYEFLVEAALPLLGLVIRYEGWLEPA